MMFVPRNLASLILTFGLAAAPLSAVIELRGGPLDTSSAPPADEAALSAIAGPGGEGLALVQFDGPIQPEWLDALAAAGAEVHHAIPEFAYLVSLAPSEAEAVHAVAHVTWVGALPPALRVERSLTDAAIRAAAGTALDVVILSEGPLDSALLRADGFTLRQSRETPMGWRDTRATIDPALLSRIAETPNVFLVERQRVPRLMGERAAQTAAGNYLPGAAAPTGPGYTAWLASRGLTGGTLSNGSPLIAQVQDDGLDQGIATNAPGTAHPDILGRIAGIYNATSDASGDGRAGHGQINAGIIMGNATVGTADGAGYRLGQGMAPLALVYATKLFRNSGAWDLGSDTLTTLAQDAQNHGVLFSNNSWGTSDAGAYNEDSAELDALTRDADPGEPGNQPITYFVAAGNDGPGNGTIGSPATGKNVIAVGAGENSDADGTDGCGSGPSDANSLRDLVDFSSRGPTDDNRFGVTVFAVGTHVQGPASTSPFYDGTGVCDQYWPAGQTNYARSSGTSHSTPIACGAGMVIHEFFDRQLSLLGHTAAPSPAMIRAVLVATATDMAGGNNGAGGTLTPVPNPQQGWGAVNLTPLVDNPTRLVSVDQSHLFTASGQVFERQVTVSDPGQPLRIALSWTDQPANPLAVVTLINDLDLEVIGAGGTYLGNVFTGGASTTGGTADRRNTTECVFLSAPTGSYTVRVRAFNIAGDGVPNTGGALDQDFALFAWNATTQSQTGTIDIEETAVAPSAPIHVRVSDTGLTGSAPISVEILCDNPGDMESLTLTEAIPNSGVLTGMIATGSAPGAPGDGTLQVAHGATITAIYQDADAGGGAPGIASDEATVDGLPPVISNVSVTEAGFDRLTIQFTTSEPASGSVALGTACGAALTTRSSGFGTAHEVTVTGLMPCTTYRYTVRAADAVGNRADAPATGCFGGATLATAVSFTDDFEPAPETGWTHSAALGVDNWAVRASANAHSPTQVYSYEPGTNSIADASLVSPAFPGGGTFSFWHTHQFEQGGGIAFDGGVLEISTNGGGTWSDLGPFITEGGYNATIDTFFGSPIAGRPAWSGGTFGAMTRVQVNLAGFAGQTCRVRFRFGSDNGVSSGGWRIDDIQVFTTEPCTAATDGILEYLLGITSVPAGLDFNGDGEVDVSDLVTLIP